MEKLFMPTWETISFIALMALLAGALFGAVMALVKASQKLRDRDNEWEGGA
jgi:hypothetical protein